MDDIISKLRNAYNDLGNKKNEENVKIHVIVNIFIEYYGYNNNRAKKITYEEKIVKGYCDIYIPTIGEKALIIEVKNGEKALDIKDIEQVKTYTGSKGQRFAILTNGYEYMLLDFSIITSPMLSGNVLKSYIVFWFDIFKGKANERTGLRYFKYLSFTNLYQKQATCLYCDIAQYRVWKYEQGMKEVSWVAYRCTLFLFFDFLAPKFFEKKNYEQVGRKMYENIDIDEFDDFIVEVKRHGKNTSTKTLNNNYTHIYNMLYELKKHNRIGYISLNDSRKNGLAAYEETEQRRGVDVIKTEEVKRIFEFLKGKRNYNRDMVIVLLEMTLGLERSQMVELKWDNFDKGYKHINIDEKKIELCPLLQSCLEQLRMENRKQKIKSSYIFQVFYKGSYRPISEGSINDVFNSFIQISKDEKWKKYSPKYVRNSLIRTLFFAGFSLEDIMYITGIDICNISKYIKMNELLQRRSKKIEWKQLYDGILCEKEDKRG